MPVPASTVLSGVATSTGRKAQAVVGAAAAERAAAPATGSHTPDSMVAWGAFPQSAVSSKTSQQPTKPYLAAAMQQPSELPEVAETQSEMHASFLTLSRG